MKFFWNRVLNPDSVKCMRRKIQAGVLVAVMSAGLASAGNIRGWANTFFGTAPTGLIDLTSEYRYPVFLYVPQAYKPDRRYPLIISLPSEGEAPDKNIEYWMSWAKRRTLLVLSVTNLRPEDTPYASDAWIISIKKDIASRYQIDPSRVFLVGRRGGAHYAGYLGANYPEEFSAVMMLEGSWSGQYEKLLRPKSRPVKQIPFLVVSEETDTALIGEIERSAGRFEKKGYLVSLMKVKGKEQFETLEFKEKVLEWGQSSAEAWGRKIHESRKSWKEKTLNWTENFFHV